MDAAKTARQAFRESTHTNHKVMFRTYLSFCIYFGLRDIEPETSTICLYIEFLTRTFQSPQSVKNYVSAINLLHNINMRPPPVKTFAISIMLRAIQMTMKHVPEQKLPITPQLLHRICEACDSQGSIGRTLKAAYLLLFFTFIRQSSLAPKSSSLFSALKHVTKADVFFTPDSYIVLVKWTKTHQSGQHV